MSQPIDNRLVVNEPGITTSYSYVYDCRASDNLSIQAVITGGNGTFQIFGSNDNINFVAIPTTLQSFTGTSDVLCTIYEPAYPWLSAVITSTSGTLDLSLTIFSRSHTVTSN